MLNKVDWIGFCYQSSVIEKVKVVRNVANYDGGLCSRVLCSDDELTSLACGIIAQGTEQKRASLIYRALNQYGTLITLVTEDDREIHACIYILSATKKALSNEVVNDAVAEYLKALKLAIKIKSNKKQQEVIKLTALGFERCQIAMALSMTPRGVDYHIKNAKDFLGAHNKSNMVFLAAQQGWLN